MSLVGAGSAPIPAVAAPRSLAASVLVPAGTIVVLIALALLPLLTPLVMHRMLDASQAPAWLGASPADTHTWSDATVRDLVLWGSFDIRGPGGTPLYGPDEVAHLGDARLLLWGLFGVAAISAVALAARVRRSADRSGTWRGIARGGAIAAAATVVIGVVGLVAFEPLFELFHRVFFPGGNWAFDPGSQRLVQLYPFAFWELAAAGLGLGIIVLGAATWMVGQVMARGGRA